MELTVQEIEQLDAIRLLVSNNVEYFNTMVNEVADNYTVDLNAAMDEIMAQIVNVPDPPLPTVEHHFAKLSALLYYVGSQMESLGIRDDVSEQMQKEVYNTEYLTQQEANKDKKPTSATLIALSENKSMYESLLNSMYSRAYKIVKFRVESADRMCATLSKIMSRRMQEMSYPEPTDALGRPLSKN